MHFSDILVARPHDALEFHPQTAVWYHVPEQSSLCEFISCAPLTLSRPLSPALGVQHSEPCAWELTLISQLHSASSRPAITKSKNERFATVPIGLTARLQGCLTWASKSTSKANFRWVSAASLMSTDMQLMISHGQCFDPGDEANFPGKRCPLLNEER